jgi:hypothetical protein
MRSAEQRLDQLAEEAVLPVQVAMERVRLYTLIGDASRALEVGATALDLSTAMITRSCACGLPGRQSSPGVGKRPKSMSARPAGQTTRDLRAAR